MVSCMSGTRGGEGTVTWKKSYSKFDAMTLNIYHWWKVAGSVDWPRLRLGSWSEGAETDHSTKDSSFDRN